MLLDVIIPSFNEEGNVELVYKELTNVLKDIKYNLIFIDDGSKDKTLNKLVDIYNKDKKHVRIISFSRNFGKDAAIYAGLKNSRAEYTAIIDSDMQQNPKHLLEMVKYLEKHPDFDAVAMVNNYQDESFMSRFMKKNFYKILNKMSEQDFVTGASDFRVFRKYVVDALITMGENNRFTKGMFSWVGFNTYYMPYKVDKRHSGESKFKLRRQLSYALEGILNFSAKPLKLATILGSLISIVSFIYLIQIFFQTIIFGKDLPGYASTMCVILLLGGIQLLVLGIIGEYLAKTYLETKNRPIYLEKKKYGFDDDIL